MRPRAAISKCIRPERFLLSCCRHGVETQSGHRAVARRLAAGTGPGDLWCDRVSRRRAAASLAARADRLALLRLAARRSRRDDRRLHAPRFPLGRPPLARTRIALAAPPDDAGALARAWPVW